MKTKRLLALFLTFVMVLGTLPMAVFAADEATITAYITVSQYGEILTDANGTPIATAPITLTGKTSYTLDDAFVATHNAYYNGGAAAGYGSAEGTYGLSVTKFWGDTSGQFGYQVNRGTEYISGLSHEITDGDFIDVYLLKSAFPDTEAYSTFDMSVTENFAYEGLELTLCEAGYDDNWNTIFSPCQDAVITIDGVETDTKTDATGKTTLTFDTPGTYLVSAVKSKQVNNQTVPAITAPVCKVTVKALPDACITVPSDTTLFVGQKVKHFVLFTEIPAIVSIENQTAGTISYYYELTDGNKYNLRITSDAYITYATAFQKTANFSLTVDKNDLDVAGKTKTTIDHNTASNNEYNVADLFLNINPQGYLKLAQVGDTYQLVPLRNWETTENLVTSASDFFAEPDYHYTIINESGEITNDVVTVNKENILTAVGEGTAIVLVTYDALQVPVASGGPFFGAIWPENTGVFVVSVGAEVSGIKTGMTLNEGKNKDTIKLSGDTIDVEHDVIYFLGDTGSYTFTPETEECAVSIANPIVDSTMHFGGFDAVAANNDGSVTVPLTEGRNIVKLEKDGKAEYQVITAKQVTVTINNGESVHPGDTVSVVFDTLYHPANKLAGVYNMSALPIYTNVSGYSNKLIGGLPAQYDFASSSNAQTVNNVLKERNVWGSISYEKDADLIVPADYTYDTFTLTGGMIYTTGFGDAYGNHRGIDLTTGKAPNLTAETRMGWLGTLPDIEIPIVVTDSALSSISLDTTNVKTDYYAGESFDTNNLVVMAAYEDGKTQTATNYTVTPEILSADTEYVTITYRGKTATVDVTVSPAEVTALEVTTPPFKTTYTEGAVFDPTGMVITAIYNNGRKVATTDYSYAPHREILSTDTAMTVTYMGEDAAEGLTAVAVPITVTGASQGGISGSSASTITVYFTLLGDDVHGNPTGTIDTHTLKAKNLETWITKKTVTVTSGSSVLDAIIKALSIAGIPYSNPDGNYISSIRGLAEFDNGIYSGWMYTLNGKHSNLGVSEQTLKQGDSIVLHYTDDYTQEDDSVNNSSNNSVIGSMSNLGTTSTQTTQPSATVVPEEIQTGTTFTDVNEDDWYYEAVQYVSENDLMNGTGTGFEPDSAMTRAMLVTVLYRLENPEKAERTHNFTDVANEEWYAEAVAWAAESGVVNGVSETEFAPNDNITREQMATILFRYAQFKGYDTANTAELSQFTDFAAISDWALSALQWANADALIQGTSETTLSPQSTTTRAQVATILMRFCEMN